MINFSPLPKLGRSGSLLLSAMLLMAGLSGCLTIRETYSFKKNGAGSMRFEVQRHAMDGAFEEVQKELIPQNWSFDSLAGVLGRLPGIEKVQVIDEPKTRSIGLAFQFESVKALNQALSRLLLADTTAEFAYFQVENGVWTRRHQADQIKMSEAFLARLKSEQQAAAMFQALQYEVSMTFPRPVAVAYTGSEGSIAGKKSNTLRLNSSLYQVATQASRLEATVLLD